MAATPTAGCRRGAAAGRRVGEAAAAPAGGQPTPPRVAGGLLAALWAVRGGLCGVEG